MVQVNKSTISNALCEYIQPWRGKCLPVDAFVTIVDVGVTLDDMCSAIEQLGIADEPLPADAVRKLELFDGATYAHAIALLLWAWDQRQPVEEAEEEAELLMLSKARRTKH